jgi:hypothetical protein
MNSLYQPCLLILFACCLTPSCTKQGNSTATGSTIYIAGDNGISPVLWKNGNGSLLSASGGSASQVVVSGSDVYIAGVTGVNEAFALTPAGPAGQNGYWKNGVLTNIGNFELLGASPGGSIAVAGGNVYFSDGPLWNNGSLVSLQAQGTYGSVRGAFASGNNIYAVGSDNNNDAVYWKNGTLNVIGQSNSQTAPSANCIYVSGNDVYIGGVDANQAAVYWKNGVPVYLQASTSGRQISRIGCIYVSGNDVYVIGNTYGAGANGYLAPAYWKNGAEVDLPLNGATYGLATGIYVNGSDVYVTGSAANGAVYWKNGVETVLSSTGSANSIYIQ